MSCGVESGSADVPADARFTIASIKVDGAPIPLAPIDIAPIDFMPVPELIPELDCALAAPFVETLGATFCSAGACCASAAFADARIGLQGHTFADAHAGRDESSAITGTATATAAAIVTKTAATLSTRIARSTAPQPECTWNRTRRRRMSEM
jgi:hypothetical protein